MNQFMIVEGKMIENGVGLFQTKKNKDLKKNNQQTYRFLLFYYDTVLFYPVTNTHYGFVTSQIVFKQTNYYNGYKLNSTKNTVHDA